MAPVLAEDLGRRCFLGYEDADVEELRGMVHLFMEQAGRAGEQQRRAFAQLASTAEAVGLAQRRLEQLHGAEVDAEARAASLAEELDASRAELQAAARQPVRQQVSERALAAEFQAVEVALSFERECRAERSAAADAQISGLRTELGSARQALSAERVRNADSIAVQDRTASLASELAAVEAALAQEKACSQARRAEAATFEQRANSMFGELSSRNLDLSTVREELMEKNAVAKAHADSLSSEILVAQAQISRLNTEHAEMEKAASGKGLTLLGCRIDPSVTTLSTAPSDKVSELADCQAQEDRTALQLTGSRSGSMASGSLVPNFRYQDVGSPLDLGEESLQVADAKCFLELSPTKPQGDLEPGSAARARLAAGICQDAAADRASRLPCRRPAGAPGGAGGAPRGAGSPRGGAAGPGDDVVTLETPTKHDRSRAAVDHPEVDTSDQTRESRALACSHEAGTNAGLRYLLGRRQAQGNGTEDPCKRDSESGTEESRQVAAPACEAQSHEPPEPGCCTDGAAEPQATNAAPLAAGAAEVDLSASWAEASLTASMGPLVDRLYDECIARGGGQLRGAADVRRVLLDIAGEGACAAVGVAAADGPQRVDEPPELLAVLQGLGASLDSEVSRVQFRALVKDALKLRQSQEVRSYEGCIGAEEVPPSTGPLRSLADVDVADSAAPLRSSVRQSTGWVPLPSWSVELSRLSCDGCSERPHEAPRSSAGEHWCGVESALERLRSLVGAARREAPQLGEEGPSALQDLRCDLAAFVRGFAEEARSRLRASHSSSGRLLEQRRRAVDNLSAQLEERDLELQSRTQECAGLTARLRAMSASVAHAEGVAEAALRAEAAAAAASSPASQGMPRTSKVELPSPRASTTSLVGGEHHRLEASAEQLAEEVESLRGKLAAAERQHDAAEASCQELRCQLEALAKSYEEDARAFHAGSNHPHHVGSSVSASTLFARMGPPNPLEKELQDVARSTALRQAEEAEATLREELQAAHGELELNERRERRLREEQDEAAAAEAAALQERVAELHGGSWFEKVSFRRQVKQPRFVRLTFDLKRIEWGQNQFGPFKVLPVDAILRVDFGDASRSFRCFEFGRQAPPAPGRCVSISTPSRSLDLIASSEREVETWVLGLNEVVPYRPERQRFTAQEFYLRRALLRLEVADERAGAAKADPDCETASGCSSSTARASRSEISWTGSLAPSLRGGSEGGRSGVRRLLLGR